MNTFRYVGAWSAPAAVFAAAPLLPASPVLRLVWTTIVAYAAIKLATVLLGPGRRRSGDSPMGRLLWWTVWPGVDAAPFRRWGKRDDALNDPPSDPPHDAVAPVLRAGLVRMSLGLLACTAVAAAAAAGAPSALIGWAGIAAILLTLHLGYTDVLTALLRRTGFAVERPFPDPLGSRSLREFWGVRWNRPYSEMSRILVTEPLRRRLGPRGAVLAAFCLSAFLHEMAISYPASGGVGGPAAYFVLHGALVLSESRLRPARWPGWLARTWTWGWLLVPLPLLFHSPFRDALVVPLFTHLGGLFMSPSVLQSPTLVWLFSLALYLGALGHVLLAAIAPQVPRQLKWREELAVLSPINRNLFWTYGSYIAATNLAFGVYTFAFHDDMLAGVPAALAVAGFIGVYWLVRLVLDFWVLPFDLWPKDRRSGMWMAHAALAGLFCCLTGTYLGLVLWHFGRGLS